MILLALDHRIQLAVQEESPSGRQWGLCYQEPGHPNEVTQVLESTFVEGAPYRLQAEIYWDYNGIPLRTYQPRLVGAESGEVVTVVDQDSHTPRRG